MCHVGKTNYSAGTPDWSGLVSPPIASVFVGSSLAMVLLPPARRKEKEREKERFYIYSILFRCYTHTHKSEGFCVTIWNAPQTNGNHWRFLAPIDNPSWVATRISTCFNPGVFNRGKLIRPVNHPQANQLFLVDLQQTSRVVLVCHWVYHTINPLWWPRNILADCLAKSAPRLSLQHGFRCDPEHLRWETRRAKILEDGMMRGSTESWGSA